MAQGGHRLVASTVADLSGREAFAWFQECESLLYKQPQKASLLTDWMRLILTQHCSYLLANQELKAQLQPFYKALQERVQSHESLLRVSGKLDLLITTAGDRIAAQQNQNEALQEPLRKFREGDDLIGGADQAGDLDEDLDGEESDLDDDELAALMEDDFDADMLDELFM